MEICTVDEYNIPVDHRAIIANIRTSALAAGWTVEEYRSANEVWQHSVGWSSGAAPGYAQKYDIYAGWSSPVSLAYMGCFLQLQGDAFGAQGAMNRWRLYGFRTDNYRVRSGTTLSPDLSGVNRGTADVISHGWPTQQSYTANAEAPPHIQNTKLPPIQYGTQDPTYGVQRDSYARHITLPIAGTIKQWVICYGTKFIHNIINVDNVLMQHSLFGVLDLFDQTHTDGHFFQKQGNYRDIGLWNYTADQHYSLYLTYHSGLNPPFVLADGGYSMAVAETHLASLNCNLVSPTFTYYGNYYNNIVLQNTWSGKRVIHTPVVFTRATGALCAVGRTWYGILNIENLAPGQILTYGTEQYQVWPIYSIAYPNTYGIAYRIA